MVAVNLRSHFLTMRYAVPEIAKAGGGAIVNISSIHSRLGAPGLFVSYAATKGAIDTFAAAIILQEYLDATINDK